VLGVGALEPVAQAHEPEQELGDNNVLAAHVGREYHQFCGLWWEVFE